MKDGVWLFEGELHWNGGVMPFTYHIRLNSDKHSKTAEVVSWDAPQGGDVSKSHHAEMHEGQDAFDRFRKALKTIVSVPKSAVTLARKKAAAKKKRSK